MTCVTLKLPDGQVAIVCGRFPKPKPAKWKRVRCRGYCVEKADLIIAGVTVNGVTSYELRRKDGTIGGHWIDKYPTSTIAMQAGDSILGAP
jgi:hypothetical protein